ncbi:uncharacterized protein C8R40DRAFT_1110109 [Lentinula edodes]|uniref:uncharacterized protein n=1 Tax=Lentinula edodes TaxID=5353 RepID=UPI001E8E5028|nr:uncharacterized protein C8R40DRAFT_1110109 [Lentinula edodes]KAH7874238.1 hypothetical protein C8R40DRAFT_1110109 [Lentinula edodes]
MYVRALLNYKGTFKLQNRRNYTGRWIVPHSKNLVSPFHPFDCSTIIMHMVQLHLFSTFLLLSTVLGIAATPPIRRSSSAADTILSRADTKDSVIQIIFRRSNFQAPDGRSKATETIKHYASDAPWSTDQDWIIYLGTHDGYYAVPDSTAEHGFTNTKISASRSKHFGVKRRIIIGTSRSLVDKRDMAQASLYISRMKPTGKADLVEIAINYLRVHWNLQQTDEEKKNWAEIRKKMKEAEDAATEEAARAVKATGPEEVAAAEALMSMKKKE